MSRYIKQQDDLEIVYGFDHTCGYFLQVYGLPMDEEKDNLLLDECSLLTKMSNAKMIDLMHLYDIDQSQISQVAMDLPF